ncbi:MAG: ribbon-helix-helix domain-containing protein [Pseudomonadota bacterium]|nr:ribbon-helix-helix domain-containing protein [Pseudomonadota bacterium]
MSGHATSVALEPEFWSVLESLARERGLSLAVLVGEVDRSRTGGNLASALRLHVLKTLLDCNTP